MPKLGEGVSGAASCSVYHQVLVDPKREHPTSSQYVLALSMEATACPAVGPLTGQPVSVIHTGLPPTAAFVWSTALLKRDCPVEIELASVVCKVLDWHPKGNTLE